MLSQNWLTLLKKQVLTKKTVSTKLCICILISFCTIWWHSLCIVSFSFVFLFILLATISSNERATIAVNAHFSIVWFLCSCCYGLECIYDNSASINAHTRTHQCIQKKHEKNLALRNEITSLHGMSLHAVQFISAFAFFRKSQYVRICHRNFL